MATLTITINGEHDDPFIRSFCGFMSGNDRPAVEIPEREDAPASSAPPLAERSPGVRKHKGSPGSSADSSGALAVESIPSVSESSIVPVQEAEEVTGPVPSEAEMMTKATEAAAKFGPGGVARIMAYTKAKYNVTALTDVPITARAAFKADLEAIISGAVVPPDVAPVQVDVPSVPSVEALVKAANAAVSYLMEKKGIDKPEARQAFMNLAHKSFGIRSIGEKVPPEIRADVIAFCGRIVSGEVSVG